ncbi:ABC-2 family transporter protein [Clostridium puniceum]|uniref:ABC-2 family transporter protein n=1 Tax=Clostridium puniceum TaxID=29367 RepID=A0A1S8TA25_9CLOT|nr:YhgE/Pip domain-containing protein [Clostridium puniceum]OOM74454.1 ABC-2 family transporter protein [Clostridium puniceum]
MKNAFGIYKRDITKICTNWVALVMVIVIIVIPSLYSLINIDASWDPYSNTKGIKIAVINKDKGTVFKEQDINIGNELVDKLKENDKLGWVFLDDKEAAKKDLLLEKYYATIEIPENFSENVTTFVSKNVVKPTLIYTVNEKKNAIAPKMTDSGIKSLKSQLDESITKTISGVLFRVFNEKGVDIQNNREKIRKIVDNIYELDDNMSELENLLDTAISGTEDVSKVLDKTNDMIPTISDTLNSTNDFLDDSQAALDKTEGDLSDISPIIKKDLVLSEQILDNSSTELKNLDENILPEMAEKTLKTASDSAKATQETVNNLKSKLKSIKKFINNVSNMDIELPLGNQELESLESVKAMREQLEKQQESLESMQGNLKDISKIISSTIDKLDTIDEKLDILINRVDDQIDKLDNGEGLDTETLKDTIKVVDQVHASIADILNSYDSEIVSSVESGFDSIRAILDNGLTLVKEGQDTLPKIEDLLSVSKDATSLSSEELNNLKDKVPEAKDKIHELADKLREMDDEDRIDELLDMMTNSWENQSDFIYSPVEIEDNRLFSWPNYGSAATPFYTVLCLWVGGLLASALLSQEAPEFEDGTYIRPYEMYLGKLLLFISIGICQAIVASLGALFILKSYSLHPIMYVFYSIFVSIVFVTVIYTAASILHDVGKAIIIVLLVLQMAGSSGNFPIEVAPILFQKIYPFLPFTYAINGMRQVMAGIVYSILFRDMAILGVYMVISLISGILLKGVLSKLIVMFVSKLSMSGILRH